MHLTTIANDLSRQFSAPVPLFLNNNFETVKLEMKPYLQPFEQELAKRELIAFVKPDNISEEYGYHVVRTACSEQLLRKHLTYWQRVGRHCLEPTVQTLLEFTQIGMSKMSERHALHNARRLRYGPHDLHEYRGKFFPQLVRSLINMSGVAEGALVLDPMCGSGTTPCEAIADGRSAIGTDMNPLSVLIARVKAALPTEDALSFSKATKRYTEAFDFKPVAVETIWQDHDLQYLGKWFDPLALVDIASIISEINAVRKPLYKELFKICLSNIIRSVSWQKASDLRVRKEILPYEPHSAFALFMDEVKKQIDRIYPYLCVLSRNETRPILEIRHGNAVNLLAVLPEFNGCVDLLITSPPYATALPYLDTDRLSLIVLGLLSRNQHKDIEAEMIGTREISESDRRSDWEVYQKRSQELPQSVIALIEMIASHNHGDGVGFRRRNLPALLGRYYLNMLDAMRSAHGMMKPGAQGYYVVGNNSTVVADAKIEIPTDEFLFEIASLAGWSCLEKIPMELLLSRDIFKENRGSCESILCLRA